MVLITAMGLLVTPKLVAYARNCGALVKPERFKAVQPALTVVSGGVLGLCVALTSWAPVAGQRHAALPLSVADDLFGGNVDIVHAIPLTVVAGLGYLFAGMVDWWMLARLLVALFPPSYLESLLAGKILSRAVQIALALWC